jgi:hypothetical protein
VRCLTKVLLCYIYNLNSTCHRSGLHNTPPPVEIRQYKYTAADVNPRRLKSTIKSCTPDLCTSFFSNSTQSRGHKSTTVFHRSARGPDCHSQRTTRVFSHRPIRSGPDRSGISSSSYPAHAAMHCSFARPCSQHCSSTHNWTDLPQKQRP